MDDQASTQLRWSVYLLLIALAVGNMVGRLLAVDSVNMTVYEAYRTKQAIRRAEQRLKKQGLEGEQLQEQLQQAEKQIEQEQRRMRPFLSANDRSRWLAIRALVEQGTYEIDGVVDRHMWNTIDMVQHRGRDGELHLYSSKPPLLVTLLAAEYWVIHKITGKTLESHPYWIGRLMLVTINILPMVLMFILLAGIAERLGTSDWGRLFVVAVGTLGTFLTTFAVVLNNHIVGAVSATIALYAFMRIWFDGDNRLRYYALAGLAAAFTAANELPALALLGLMALALLTRDRRAWLLGFVPAAALVVVAFFATNYIAHESLRPPYMHRSETNPDDNWYRYTYTIDGVERESYWQNRQGIDRGESSKAVYAMHVLVGHHGVFSLTPVWLLSLAGLGIWLVRGTAQHRWLALGIAMLSTICLVFFIVRPLEDRNYGGMTSGFRWMFWFAPLWLTTMLPAVDRLASSRRGQTFALALLVMSVLSISYPTWNPWTQPWIYDWLKSCGWPLA